MKFKFKFLYWMIPYNYMLKFDIVNNDTFQNFNIHTNNANIMFQVNVNKDFNFMSCRHQFLNLFCILRHFIL